MNPPNNTLARTITRKSSIQTYLTIQLLVQKNLREDAYKAYAYFRWLDDQVDEVLNSEEKRNSFIRRQKQVIADSYAGKTPVKMFPEEDLVISLIKNDIQKDSGLRSYITNFFSIIEFDGNRKGRPVSTGELVWYSETIGKAVTDCILYFIGNGKYAQDPAMYKAATAAHITHALRDFWEDFPEGYINVPKEYLDKKKCFKVDQLAEDSLVDWVRSQVSLAKRNFSEGKEYISKLTSFKCKLAATLYCMRFEPLLKTIEKEGYVVRKSYKGQSGVQALLGYVIATAELIWHHVVTNG